MEVNRGLGTILRQVVVEKEKALPPKPPIGASTKMSLPHTESLPSLRSRISKVPSEAGFGPIGSSRNLVPNLNWLKTCPCCTQSQENPMIYEFTVNFLVKIYKTGDLN
jgi:hypothetical protein